MLNEKDNSYFDGPGGKPPMKPAPEQSKPEAAKPVGQVSITKTPDGHSFEFEGQTFDSADELCKALEDKFGGGEEKAEEQASPGIHEKAGGYLSKVME